METEIDFKDDPAYFYCDRMKGWFRRELCWVFYRMGERGAAETISNRTFGLNYDRMCSCYTCKQGIEIRSEFKEIPQQVKPTQPKKPAKPPKDKPKKKVAINRISIDWNALRKTDNARTGQRHRTVKAWLRWVYDKHRQEMSKTSAYVGVSPDTLKNEFRHLGLYIKGRDDCGTTKFKEIPEDEMANMTKLDISRRTGLDVKTIGALIHRYGRRYQFSGTWRGKRCG